MKPHNPYVGPRAFEEEDSRNFFGRTEEVRQLASLVIAHRVVLLYAPSGAGKTSLLKAGLIPYLKQRKRVRTLPICRVGGDLPPDVDDARVKNIYVFNTLLDLSGEAVRSAELVSWPLNEGLEIYFIPQSDQRRPQPCLLIIDQFEELFTTHPERYPERANFFFQLQDSLKEHPQLSLLLSMREDYIAQLDSYAAQLPDRLRTRFRLELLSAEAAHQAVQQPASQVDVDFTDAAAEKLINDLRKVQVQQPDGTTIEQLGRHIEPVQLQVVCRRLWEQLPEDATQIGENDVEAVGDVDTALADYYAVRVKTTADYTGIRERVIREWFDRHLITEQGIRGQVLRGPEQSQNLDNRAISPLVDAHLVRAEKRLNAIWYELAHDRLIEPVRKNNADWFQANLSPLQIQADLWEVRDRPNGLLLRDEALAEAEIWASSHQDELTPTEHNFLTACREARAIAERERRQTIRIRRLAFVSAIIGVIAIIAAVFAFIQRQEAEDARNLAQKTEQERTRSLFESYLTHASLQARIDDYAAARELLNQSRKLDEDIPAERRHTRNLLAWYVDLMGDSPIQTYTEEREQLLNIALNPDGELLAVAGEYGTVILFALKADNGPIRLEGHTENVRGVVFHPRDHLLVTAGNDHRIIFWSLPEGEKFREWEGPAEVHALALSPDGTFLASGGTDNNVTLWDVETGSVLRTLKGHTDTIRNRGLAFSPDGRLLASSSADKTARIWEAESGANRHILHGHTEPLGGIAFHPNGQILATSSDDQSVCLWDVHSGKLLHRLLGHKNEVNGVIFVNSGDRLISASRDRTLRVWDTFSGVTLQVLQGHTGSVNQLAANAERLFSVSLDRTVREWDISQKRSQKYMRMFNLPPDHLSCIIAPDGSAVAVGFTNGTLQLYTLPDAHLQWEQPNAHTDMITSVVFSPDGKQLASASLDNIIKLWQTSDGRLIRTFSAPDKEFYMVSFSPDSQLLASASHDGQIGLFRLAEEEGRFYQAHEGIAFSVAFDTSGQRLLSAGEDGEIRLWSLDSWPPTLLQSFPKASAPVWWAIFNPDESRIASVGWDARARILRVHEGAEEWVLTGHEDIIPRVVFSPDGEQAATVSTDATIRLWDLKQGGELFILRLPTPLEGSSLPAWAFDFHCPPPLSTSERNCWIVAPLSRGKLVLYDVGQPYD